MSKKVVAVVAALLILGGAYGVVALLIASKKAPVKSETKVNVISVKGGAVNYSDMVTTVNYSGRVNSYGLVTLGSEVTGRMLKGGVALKAGETFRSGDLLVNIFCKDVEASISALESNFLKTIASILPDIRVDYPNSYSKWDQFFHQIEVGKPLPKLPEISIDAEKVFISSRGILSEYYSIEQQFVQLSKYKIRAPFSGTFVSVSKEIGSIASPGGEIARIISTENIEIVVPMLVEDARLSIVGEEGYSITSMGDTVSVKLTRKSNYVDESTQMVDLYVKADNPEKLLNGEFIEVYFDNRVFEQVYSLPREAIFNTNMIYVIENSKIYKREVAVVKIDDDIAYIRGLKSETEVVLEALVGAYDGMEVKQL